MSLRAVVAARVDVRIGRKHLCLRDMIVNVTPCSCPGPTRISTAHTTGIVLIGSGLYVSAMGCSVIVYSPDGMGVSLLFTTFATLPLYEGSRHCVLRCGLVLRFGSVALIPRWRHCMPTCAVLCCAVCRNAVGVGLDFSCTGFCQRWNNTAGSLLWQPWRRSACGWDR
jgi:hypothetical protein